MRANHNQEKKNSNLVIVLLWPLCTALFYGVLREWLNYKIGLQLWDYLGVTEGIWLNVAVSIAAVLGLVLGWRGKRSHYSGHHIGLLLSVILLITLFYFDNESVPFLSYFGVIPCWILILLSFVVGIIAHHLYDSLSPLFQKRDNPESFPAVKLFQDRPINLLDNDELAYQSFAKSIASAITYNSWDESFSIGITGPWGAGKTSVLNLVKNQLEVTRDIIPIEFQPRQSASVRDIQKDFLSLLADTLASYHSGAQRIIQAYMQSLGTLPDNMWAMRFLGSISSVVLTQRRNNLIDVINKINKKIVVLIDDFDRLTGEEIQEVLKLIDKNAAFPKTFFVTAYDKKQANNVISSYFGYDRYDSVDYTDKFFNLEVSLPIRRQSNYVSVLRKHLYALADSKVVSYSREELDAALPKLYPFISKYLPSLRDVKRFSNLIAISLPQIEQDVLLGDYLLVSLIRYRYPEEYYNLGRGAYLTRNTSVVPKRKFYELMGTGMEYVQSKDVLKVLFNGKDAVYKSVAYINSHSCYFYDIDSGHLSYKALSKFLNPDITPDSFKSILDTLVTNDYQKSDFVEFILSFEESIHSFEDTLRYFRLFFLSRTYCDSRDLYIASLSYLLKDNVPENLKQFCFKDERSYSGFLREILNDRFEYQLSIETLHDSLHAISTIVPEEVPQLIFSFDELIAFARKKVDKVISEIPSSSVTPNDVYRALKACVIETIPNVPGETLDSDAISKVKKAIKSYPVFFLIDILSHRQDTRNKSSIILFIQDDAFPYLDLFKGFEDFISFIHTITDDRYKVLIQCLSHFGEYCLAQNTWTPSLPIRGDYSLIKQHDLVMYNKLFEGEPTNA